MESVAINFKRKVLSLLAWKRRKNFSVGLFYAIRIPRPDFPDKGTTNKE